MTRAATRSPAASRSSSTHEQLAALAGTSRETTTKILNEYAEQGLVRLGRGRISILDPDRMRRVSKLG